MPRNFAALKVSRDALNPALNHAILKERLADIEYYNARWGIQLARWPHFVMQRLGTHLYRYKFNYLLKGFAAYVVYSDVRHYQHMRTQVFMTLQQEAALQSNIVLHSAFFVGLCLLV